MFKKPNFKVYRGMSANIEEFQKQFPIDSTFVTFSFSSASLKLDVAKFY